MLDKKTLMLPSAAALLMGLSGCNDASYSTVNSASGSSAGMSAPILTDAQLPAGDVKLDLAKWPVIKNASPDAADLESRVDAILSQMSVEEKVGQILQPEIVSVTPEDIRKYHIGSVLNGGNGRPDNNPRANAAAWLKLADSFYEASVDKTGGRTGVPIIWGIDSVHGNNSVFGGTIFPHNIGLGAANDLDIMREMGRVTAVETAAIGLDWTFAPAVSIPRDDRWGRTYEGFSENPEIAGRLAAAYTEGLQGPNTSQDSFFRPGSIIATVKHFVADGGTENGRDQGDAVISEDEMRMIHYPPYIDALDAGAQTVMASYSKWNGVRMHGHGPLMTRLLKEHSGFDGFIIGDFNGHALIPGCTNGNCPQALMAGVDMYMIPKDWRELQKSLLAQANDGTIPMARLDDAVRRILRVKMRAGLFEMGKPSSRPFAGQQNIGTPEHRMAARKAARKSMVLLKDNDKLLPFPASSNVMVAGAGADNISMLVGGWSMNWQGTGLTNSDFPGSTTVLSGLTKAIKAGGGTTTHSKDGSYAKKPDVAVIVFGETPYAEYQGDRESMIYKLPKEDRDLRLMKKLQAQGIPVVGIFISGRPMWINPHLNASDAMVAAFLPGTEGGDAVADLLVAGTDGNVRHDFSGKLSFSWPANANQTTLNIGDADYSPLFSHGYGLTSGNRAPVAKLSEDPGLSDALLAAASNAAFFKDGRALAPWRIYLGDSGNSRLKTEGDRFVTSDAGAVSFNSADRFRQEDSKLAKWTGTGKGSVFVLGYSSVNLSDRLQQNEAIVISASVNEKPAQKVSASFGTSGKKTTIDVTDMFMSAPAGKLTEFSIPLSCFKGANSNFEKVELPLHLETSGKFTLQLTSVGIAAAEGIVAKCKP